jgi:hypothetical protein
VEGVCGSAGRCCGVRHGVQGTVVEKGRVEGARVPAGWRDAWCRNPFCRVGCGNSGAAIGERLMSRLS